MVQKKVRFGEAVVDYYLPGNISQLKSIVSRKSTVIITDENVAQHHAKRFKGWNVIVLKSGEQYKVQATVDAVFNQLIEMGVDRTWTMIGVGGGVVTDLTGFIASTFMRGIGFGFVPTTLLAMVDAAIGGKNGIDVGIYKNMVGTIHQPQFILWDAALLHTLPHSEWVNGFAEIIKHASIKDKRLFETLNTRSVSFYQKKKVELAALIQQNVWIKTKVVQADLFEKGDRKLLNFGHTLGHALENQYELSHGEAISIGMAFAARLSGEIKGFKDAEKIVETLDRYGLPSNATYNKEKVFNALQKDKKKQLDSINFVLLERLGKGVVHPIGLEKIKASL